MKEHLPVVFAAVIIAFTIALVVRIRSGIARATALLENPGVQLPVPARATPDPNAPARLTIVFTAEGIAYHDKTPLTDATLAELLAANASGQVLLEAQPTAKYAQLKSFMERLKAAGVKNLTFRVQGQ